jgi:SAM-dependent methyltransferase
MKLADLISRGTPVPWAEGDNIPWNDPDFSQRMLKEHLSQEHDAASRRLDTVKKHVQFIQRCLQANNSAECARVLDVACGPGLYTHQLARLGHTVHGIDFSPASIAYARQVAQAEGLACTYTLGDIRAADFPGENDLAMFIYGEFNVFSPANARLVLNKARAALRPGGLLLLEPHTEEMIRRMGSEPPSWYAAESGLFSASPHLMLYEAFWDEAARVATHRHILVDAAAGEVTRYSASYQAYSAAEYRGLLEECGFTNIQFFPSLTGEDTAGGLFALLAQR